MVSSRFALSVFVETSCTLWQLNLSISLCPFIVFWYLNVCVWSDCDYIGLSQVARRTLIVKDASYYLKVVSPQVLSALFISQTCIVVEIQDYLLHPLLRVLCAYPIDIKTYSSHKYVYFPYSVPSTLFFVPWLYVVWTCRFYSKFFIMDDEIFCFLLYKLRLPFHRSQLWSCSTLILLCSLRWQETS